MKTILKNANIIPMTENNVLYNYDILIEKGVIKEIGQNLKYDYTETIDCKEKYIMPSLFDMHVHLDSASMLGILFANGITNVRNMWGKPQILNWKKAIEKGEVIGPNIYSTNPLTDGINAWDGCAVVTTSKEAQQAVLKAIEEGYDYFKTYPDIPRDVFIKLMETANKHGMKVMGHGNNNVSIDELIDLGYYSLEHVSRLPQKDAEIVKIAKSGMWFTPTYFVLTKVDEYVCKKMDIVLDSYEEYVGDKCKREWEHATQIRRKDPRYETFKLSNFIRMAKTFIANSDNILLGTDTVNPGVIPGFSLHDELYQMVYAYGLEPYQAIAMGTVNAAKSLEIEDKFGTIEVNKIADLLILDKNPLTEIENSRKIFAVMKSGKLFNRAKLNEILTNSKMLVQNEK